MKRKGIRVSVFVGVFLSVLVALVMAAQEQQAQKSETFLRQNLNAMAVKLGEMQAQLMRLDALG